MFALTIPHENMHEETTARVCREIINRFIFGELIDFLSF